MLNEANVDVQLAPGTHVPAMLSIPTDARGLVACLDCDPVVNAALHERGIATAHMVLACVPTEVGHFAAVFADAVEAIARESMLFDRPIGYFGTGVGGAATLIAACMHANAVAAVVTKDAPLSLVGAHLSGVRAATLLLVDGQDETMVAETHAAMPPLPSGSMLVQTMPDEVSDPGGAAADWFDRHLRGVMRGARRELWRSA